MTEFTPLAGLSGGLLIGLAAVLLMGGIGRTMGLSSIFGALLGRWGTDNAWRALFIAGLLAGALIVTLLGGFDPDAMSFPGNPVTTIAGGLLVGIGTALGAGCTSGHGICGMALLSARSIAATALFMATAILTVFLLRHVLGG